LLERRKAAAGKARPKWHFVFEGPRGRLSNLRYALDSVTKASGVDFCIHDLRRTFATAADALDVPAYALKALLNHKSAGDVTRGYVQVTVERLREPMQKITDYFLSAGGVRPSATVVELKPKEAVA
jgi:integrase